MIYDEENEPQDKPFYGLLNDYLFHMVMQKNNAVLRHLVAALLEIPVNSIQEVVVKNPIKHGEAINYKTAILDLLLEMEDGTKMNIELQNYFDQNWIPRSLFYLSRSFAVMKKGEDYDVLKRTYQITILNADIFPESDFFNIYRLKNINTGQEYSNLLDLRLLNLTKLEYAKEEESELKRWAKAFLAKNEEDFEVLSKEDHIFLEVRTMIQELTEDENVRMQMEAAEEYERRMRYAAKMAKQAEEAEKAKMEADKAKMEADKARMESDKARMESEKARIESEKARIESEKARIEAEKAGDILQRSIRENIKKLLSMKGDISVSVSEHIESATDADELSELLTLAISSTSIEEFEKNL